MLLSMILCHQDGPSTEKWLYCVRFQAWNEVIGLQMAA